MIATATRDVAAVEQSLFWWTLVEAIGVIDQHQFATEFP